MVFTELIFMKLTNTWYTRCSRIFFHKTSGNVEGSSRSNLRQETCGWKCLLHTKIDIRSVAVKYANPCIWFQPNDPHPFYKCCETPSWYSISWLLRSSYMGLLDFFLWGHLKVSKLWAPVETEQDLKARITAVCETVQNMPGTFDKVCQNMAHHYSAGHEVGRGQCKQLL